MIAYSHAQESAELAEHTMPSSPWMTIGIGGAANRIALAGDFSYPLNLHLFSAHVIYMTELYVAIPAPDGGGRGWPVSKDIEYSLLYGLHTQGEFAMASISTGISLVESHHVTGHEARQVDSLHYLEYYTTENALSFGIPLEVQFIFNLSTHVGLGATYFTSFNHFYTYSGILMSFKFSFL